MITPNQIEEWIREVEERPSSAALVIRQVANRLSELADRNEELLAENIALQLGKKTEEYERRIANLEYQLEMLKRQVGEPVSVSTTLGASLLIYDARGNILRVELDMDRLASAEVLAVFAGVVAPFSEAPRMLVVDAQEELLFVFSTGRAVSMPVTDVPTVEWDKLDWDQASIEEPQGNETLAFIIPVARMALFENCVQVSRRGFVKKIRQPFLAACITNNNVGTGVILPADRTFDLAFFKKEDVMVLVSQEGYLLSLQVEQLPYMIEEAISLGVTDHIVSAFNVSLKPGFLAVTQNGKAFHRDRDWLEPTSNLKVQGKPILTKARLEAGVRVVGAAAAAEDDWCLVLTSDGKVTASRMKQVFDTGTILESTSDLEILSFATYDS